MDILVIVCMRMKSLQTHGLVLFPSPRSSLLCPLPPFSYYHQGVRAGSNHGGCGPNGATAEWSIVRSQFINLAQAGTFLIHLSLLLFIFCLSFIYLSFIFYLSFVYLLLIYFAGFSVEDWNALDWFIRQCIFVNIPYGATDIFGEGGFHVYESQFFGSTVADLVYGNCGKKSNARRDVKKKGGGGRGNRRRKGETVLVLYIVVYLSSIFIFYFRIFLDP